MSAGAKEAKEKAARSAKAAKAKKTRKAAPAERTPGRPAAVRTLWLLRHAKTVTDPPPGGADFDRVLAPRGRRDATALGRLFAGAGEGLGAALDGVPRPGVALVSPAARTAATAELVLAGMDEPPACRFDKDLYGADPDELLGFITALPDEVRAAMVVGHNPTAHSLSQGLLSARDKKGLSLAARQGFPTCALGVYTFPVEHWADVSAGSATLVTLIVPPYT
jgi:phosphohistidine phosphatase